jgi:recombinational DNA repair ATPase RecF
MIRVELDSEGYPTDESLATIANVLVQGRAELIELFDAIVDAWHWSSYVKRVERTNGTITWRFATGGWSGNESLIHALMSNISVYASLSWVASCSGGLHIFRVKAVRDE